MKRKTRSKGAVDAIIEVIVVVGIIIIFALAGRALYDHHPKNSANVERKLKGYCHSYSPPII